MKIQLACSSSLVLVFELKTQLKTYDSTYGPQFSLRKLRIYIATLEFGLLLMLTAMLCLEIRSLYIQMSCKCQAYLHVDDPFFNHSG
jgi:hypothetical protein